MNEIKKVIWVCSTCVVEKCWDSGASQSVWDPRADGPETRGHARSARLSTQSKTRVVTWRKLQNKGYEENCKEFFSKERAYKDIIFFGA